MRLWVRLRIFERGIDWDDAFIIAAFLISIGEAVVLVFLTHSAWDLLGGDTSIDALIFFRKVFQLRASLT